MENRVEQAILQLRDDLIFFNRRAQETQAALQALMTQTGLTELRIGVIPSVEYSKTTGREVVDSNT